MTVSRRERHGGTDHNQWRRRGGPHRRGGARRRHPALARRAARGADRRRDAGGLHRRCARPIWRRGCGSTQTEVAAEFAARDALIRRHGEFDRVSLWFEHDLYDQLQLVQILAFFAAEHRSAGLTLVQADDFLGAQTVETILSFAAAERAVTDDDLTTGLRVWDDLTEPMPEPIAARRDGLDSRLPFLGPALTRFLEELPAPGSGLARSEAVILAGIDAGIHSAGRLFHALIAQEEAAFMGDASFFCLLDDLAFCAVPLIAGLAPPSEAEDDDERTLDAVLELTMAGDNVLAGEDDHVSLNGLSRWWAGTHLQGHDVWRYDRGAGRLVPPDGSGA